MLQASSYSHDEHVHYIAVKGWPYTDFKDYIQLEKINSVKFQSGSYENESNCRDFIKAIMNYFFKKIYTRNFYK